MKNIILTPALMLAAAVAGAQPTPEAVCQELAPRLVGRTVDAALKLELERVKLQLRIVSEGGRPLPATMDFRPDRVSLYTQEQKIVRADCG